MKPQRPLPSLWSRRATLCLAAVFIAAWVALLAISWVRHEWFADAQGRPLPIDFLEVWVAGKSVLAGIPTAPYDWHFHHTMQVAAVGHPFKGFLGWHYPPPFLFVAAGLALLPFAAAFVSWLVLTVGFFSWSMAGIAGRVEAVWLGLAFPPVLANFYAGQNGCLSAALIGGALLLMEARPAAAGVLLGLLTYKPQLGLLFPIVFLLGKRWRVLSFATATALCGIIVSYLILGIAPFHAFLHYLPQTSGAILANGSAGWNKLQTVYGLVRWIGGSNNEAWIIHVGISFVAMTCTILIWSRPEVSSAEKAATLALGCVVATPYLYFYDLPILAVSLAFLFKDRAFDPTEWTVVILVDLVLLSFMWQTSPVGPIAILLIMGLIARRLRMYRTEGRCLVPSDPSAPLAPSSAAI